MSGAADGERDVVRQIKASRRRFDMTAWLARYLLGPAQVTDPRRAGRTVTEGERAREGELRGGFERVRGASGREYLVARDDAV